MAQLEYTQEENGGGCLICGVRHIGACSPDHPEHRPLSAEEWAERENASKAAQAEWAEKEAAESRAEAAEGKASAVSRVSQAWDQIVSQPLERAKNWLGEQQAAVVERVENWREERAYPAAEQGRGDKPQERPDKPCLRAEAEALKGDALGHEDFSTGPTVAVPGAVRLLHSKADAEQYAQGLPQSQQYRIERVLDADGPTDSYVVTSHPHPPPAEVARDEGRYDVETPGPTEAAGQSFRVLPSKEAAEEYVQTLPPSQQNRIDQALEAGGPTDSYVVTSGPLPSVKEVARDEYVAQQVAAIEDPATRARAEQLLQTIREEAAARERPTPHRSQEVELER